MANITKQKREQMIAFLKGLKAVHNDDASVRAFNEIENHLKDKKFGIVFEEHTEEVDEKLVDYIPVFSEDENRKILKDKEQKWNFLIEGDNLQSLYLLEKTHFGKIDCIYIDPPYNTGAKTWKYNNDYVDKKDTYRHSKWLSMMSVRMSIAKKLLKEDGVFICAIDENELATTLLLIEDVFGENYKSDCITVVHNPRGIQGDNFSYINEYAIFTYRKGLKAITTRELSEEEIDWSPLRNWGDESERHDAANCFYPIYVKDGKIVGFGDDVTSDDSFHPNKNEYDKETDTYAVYPIDVEGVERKWRYARQSVESIIDLLRVKQSDDEYDIEIGKDFAPYRTVWNDKKYDANVYGTQLIKSMIPNCDFSFPKSIYTVYECLYAVTKDKPDAIILDYFAGSGTTGHATLMMNKLLGGNRHFILCTNNDVGEKKEKEYKKKYGEIDSESDKWIDWKEKYGIASSVTYPRIKSTIEGFKHKKDFKTSLLEKKLTASSLSRIDTVLAQIEEIKEREKNNYTDIKVVVEDNTVKILGIVKKAKEIKGIPSNLKYYKCDWTERHPEDYFLSNALCLHIKEMIELQNAIEIDGCKNLLLLNKSDIEKAMKLKKEQIESIWLNQSIIAGKEEMKFLNEVGFKYIPREFFGQELKEAAE